MNNNDERDYAEEAANRAELENLDGPPLSHGCVFHGPETICPECPPSPAERVATGVMSVAAVTALITSPATPAMLAAVAGHLRGALGDVDGPPRVDPAELDDIRDDAKREIMCNPQCDECPHCAGCGGSFVRGGPYGCTCDDDDDDQPGAWCDERCGDCGTC